MRVLFGQPRFSDQHNWAEVVDHFPAELAHRVTVETIESAGLLARLRDGGPRVDILVPIMAPVTQQIFELDAFSMIQQFGVGTEAIDLDAAEDHDIPVANMPGLNAPYVAEHAIALLLALMRRLPEARAGFAPGHWGSPAGASIAGSTVCVVGLGAIGTAVAHLLSAFGATVLGVHRSAIDETALPAGISLYRAGEMDEALGRADAVIVAASATPGAPAALSAQRIAAVKPGAFVVNVARGAVIDNDAGLAAVQSGHLAGLGLDVFAVEPYPADGPLLADPRVIATAHTGALTSGYFAEAARRLGDSILRFEAGQPLENLRTARRP